MAKLGVRLSLYALMIMIAFLTPSIINAKSGDSDYAFPIEGGDCNEDGDEDDVTPEDTRRRSWQTGQICTIDPQNGVRIPGVAKADIITYEVWDSNGVCMAAFENEGDFLSFIGMASGNVRIVFRLSSCYLFGYVTL